MEEFEYLNDIIDNLLEKKIINRQRKCRIEEEEIDRNIRLSDIEKYNFSDDELEYVMNSLKEKGIYVIGSSPAYYANFDNYIYAVKKGVPQKTKKVTKTESLDLLKKYKETHDINDRNKLVESYIGLVNFIASKYVNVTGIDHYELASYGYEGLIVSIEKLDFSKHSVSSYIHNTINGYILNGISKEQGFSCNDQFYLDYIKARKKVLYKYEEDNMTEYELLDEILEEILKNRKDSQCSQEKSKNKFYYAYASSIEQLEMENPKNEIEDLIDEVFQQELNDVLIRTLESVTPVQKQNIMLRYGFDMDAPLSLSKIAKIVGLSANGVDLSVKRGIQKIKNNKKSIHSLKEFIV